MLSRYFTLEVVLAVGPALAAVSGPLSSSSCPADSPLSCQNTTAYDNTCCFNYPGGQILQTQFWDTNPSTGPADSWTIHGLWPDNCDGTFEQTCDKNRQYTNISEILSTGAPSVLEYIQTYWKDYKGNDESFWEHEFGKHGTCISTLEPSCYSDYQPGDEVVDYFNRTVQVFKSLPSYDWLAAAGIVPSATETYTLAAIQAALEASHGHDVIINCNGKELNELWYQFNVQGSIQSGKFVPADLVGSPSTCPSTGIKYLPKDNSTPPSNTPPPTTETTSATPTSTPTGEPESGALSGKGYLYISTQASSSGGFLISGGEWYRGGSSPATYTATPDADGSTFTLNTSKGKCAVQGDASFACAGSISAASSFGYDGGSLTYEGSDTFYAAELPSGTTQETVYSTSKGVSFQVTWTAV